MPLWTAIREKNDEEECRGIETASLTLEHEMQQKKDR
jgi:hypothetical protein